MENESTDIKDIELNASNVINLKMQDLAPDYVGQNTFNNLTDTEQIYSTVSYSHASLKSTSTSVTKGFTINGKGTTFKVPLILPTG